MRVRVRISIANVRHFVVHTRVFSVVSSISSFLGRYGADHFGNTVDLSQHTVRHKRALRRNREELGGCGSRPKERKDQWVYMACARSRSSSSVKG